MTFARVKPPVAPNLYLKGTLLQITSSGIEIGETMKWWLKVAVATGNNEIFGSSHRTIIQTIHPDTNELVRYSWITQSLKPLPPGEEVEAVEQLLSAIAQESQISEVATTSDRFELSRIEVLEELSFDEAQERQRLERKVERAFYEAGSALRELRDQRLYRSTHKTFEAYCQDRFQFQRTHSYQLIDAAGVVDNLSANRGQILPTKEFQVRSMVSFEPTEQVEIWQEAVEQAGGKVPSARIVRGVVDRIKAKNPSPAKDFCLVGDIFTLHGLQESQRRYNGVWCIVVEIFDYSMMVDTVFGEFQVKPENLDPIDCPGVNEKLKTTLIRIRRLNDLVKEGESAKAVLDDLGRKLYLTSLDELILKCIEKHYISDEEPVVAKTPLL
jgi:hypothetical protein